jgi:hypothetical protein
MPSGIPGAPICEVGPGYGNEYGNYGSYGSYGSYNNIYGYNGYGYNG